MKLSTVIALSAASYAAAFPFVLNIAQEMEAAKEAAKMTERSPRLTKRYVEPPPRQPVRKLNLPNTGTPPLPFNAEDQYTDVSPGSGHEWQAPLPGQTRGQCPGLNAAANHGFLDRSGITTIAQATTGLMEAYSFAESLGFILGVIAVGLSGDPVTQRWSIGAGFTPAVPLFPARGLFGLHNKYEGDASIMRGDAYLNNGNVGVFEMRRWEHFWNLGETYTLDEAAAQSDYNTRWSVLNNPYYFSGPFSGLVAPAANRLPVDMMSNHSADVPGGTLTRDIMKSFFSVTGDAPGNFTWVRGHDRIPDNWYKRASLQAFTTTQAVIGVFTMNSAYPGIYRLGGNTGTTDSFTGVDTESLTNGAFNLETLTEGNNAACFFLQASLAGLPDASAPVLGAVGSVLGWVTQQLGPTAQSLGCPQLKAFNNDLFNQFPGASYTGSGTG